MLDKFKEINWDPDKSEVNGFCKTLLVGFPIAGFVWLGIAWLFSGNWIWSVPIWFAGVGWFIGLAGFSSYFLGCLFYRIWFFMIGIIDTILTNVLLVTLFYCILTPYSLLIRVFKRDSMRRSIDSESESYFESVEKPKGPESYYNQF